jgi:DNA-directed RNA polymerase specialized sigma24 family protein
VANNFHPAGDDFELFLTWLNSDREAAGREYERIRTGLIKIFLGNGHSNAEDLADEVLARSIAKAPEVAPDYDGDPFLYVRGVARNVVRESRRARPEKELPRDMTYEEPDFDEDTEIRFECLSNCLDMLKAERRDLILDYYGGSGKGKHLENRRRLCQVHGLTESGLRQKAARIRERLRTCVTACINKNRHVSEKKSLYSRGI